MRKVASRATVPLWQNKTLVGSRQCQIPLTMSCALSSRSCTLRFAFTMEARTLSGYLQPAPAWTCWSSQNFMMKPCCEASCFMLLSVLLALSWAELSPGNLIWPRGNHHLPDPPRALRRDPRLSSGLLSSFLPLWFFFFKISLLRQSLT